MLHISALLGHPQATVHLLKFLHCVTSSQNIPLLLHFRRSLIKMHLLQNVTLYLFFRYILLAASVFFVFFYLTL
jgi:hypothetical protein